MSWVAVGGAAIGVVGSLFGSSKSNKAAKEASRAAAAASAAELAFEKKKYADWKKTYGGIEKNLAKYYDDLSPQTIAVRGLEAYEKEKETAMTTLKEDFAQRGIELSGIAAQVNTDVAIASSEERARIRADAPMQAAREKSSFLQVGLGQDPSGGVSGALANSASRANRTAEQTARLSGAATSNVIAAGTNLASELVGAFQKERTIRSDIDSAVLNEDSGLF